MAKTAKVVDTSESLITAASVICGQLGASAVFVHADAMKDLEALSQLPDNVERFVTTCSPDLYDELADTDCRVFRLPSLSLNRIDAIKMGVVIALSEGAITKKDTIVCLSGLSENEQIDTLIVFRLDQEKEMMLTPRSRANWKGWTRKFFQHSCRSRLNWLQKGVRVNQGERFSFSGIMILFFNTRARWSLTRFMATRKSSGTSWTPPSGKRLRSLAP